MAEVLNSSNLVLKIDQATPVNSSSGPWGNVSYPQGTLQNPVVYQRLTGVTDSVESFGTFALGGRLTGVRGTLQATVTIGATGADRSIGYLADTLTPTTKILMAIDAMNRPFCLVQNNVGTTVAKVIPTWASSLSVGQQVTVKLCWDSTQVVDGTRFALFMVNTDKVGGTDWMTNPITSWTSFIPNYIILGDSPAGGGAPALPGFNGQILSFQVSNNVVTDGSTGSFVSTRILDRVVSDSVSGTTT